jgi:hypothetical protein
LYIRVPHEAIVAPRLIVPKDENNVGLLGRKRNTAKEE